MNLLVYIKPVIQYANAILLTIKEMAKSLALVKQQTDNIDYEQEFAGFGNSIEETTDAVNELNEAMGTLLGFDTLNILGSNANNSVVGGLSVEGNILDALKEYTIQLDKVNYKAKDVSEQMLTWLGYTKTLNEETGEFVWVLGDGYTNLEMIKDLAISLITFLGTKAIITKVATLVTHLGEIKGVLSVLSGPIGLIVTAVATLVTGFADVYKSSEDFRISVDNSLSNIKTNLSTIWDFIKNDVYPKLKPILDVIWDIISNIGAILVNNILKSFEALTFLLKGDFSGAMGVVVQWIKDLDSAMARIFGEETWMNIKNWIVSAFQTIKNTWNEIVDSIINAWESFSNWFDIHIIQPISNFFNEIKETIEYLKGEANNGNWSTGGGGGGGFGGRKIDLSTPTITPVGNYKEISSTTPIQANNYIQNAIVESMLPLAQAILSGNSEVVGAIGELANRPIELNGRKVSQNIYDDLQKEARRRGHNSFNIVTK